MTLDKLISKLMEIRNIEKRDLNVVVQIYDYRGQTDTPLEDDVDVVKVRDGDVIIGGWWL